MNDDRVSVLYIVAQFVPTSIPLEVARVMSRHELDLSVTAFKVSSDRYSAEVDCRVLELGARSFFDPLGVWNLYECIEETRPDVVHVHHTSSAFWGAILAKFVASTTVVRTEHNDQRHHSLFQSVLHGCSQAIADKVLCNSKSTYINLYPAQKWAVGDNWEVVYNGVDIDRIRAAVSRQSPLSDMKLSHRRLIGSVGNLVDQKNYRRLIQAFSLVVKEISGLHLVLIGEGDNRAELEKEVRARGIEAQVTFTGELPRDDVYAVLHQLDVFVMPSLWEGFCNAVVEASAVGLPVVCSDISTLHEVMGDAALYVDPNDPDDIAGVIIELLKEDTEAQEQLGKKARERATERYTIERTAKKYLKTYREVTEEGSP